MRNGNGDWRPRDEPRTVHSTRQRRFPFAAGSVRDAGLSVTVSSVVAIALAGTFVLGVERWLDTITVGTIIA